MKRKTRKEKNRVNCLRLQTLSNIQLKKRWIKNHCRKTSKRLICKISGPTTYPCDDGRYVVFERLVLRDLRRLPPAFIRK